VTARPSDSERHVASLKQVGHERARAGLWLDAATARVWAATSHRRVQHPDHCLLRLSGTPPEDRHHDRRPRPAYRPPRPSSTETPLPTVQPLTRRRTTASTSAC